MSQGVEQVKRNAALHFQQKKRPGICGRCQREGEIINVPGADKEKGIPITPMCCTDYVAYCEGLFYRNKNR